MYIEPSTIIKLLTNVKLDNSYNNTIFFATRSAQSQYFNSKVKYTLNNNSFQRVSRNTCRVNVAIGDLYDCSYMMFSNTRFSNRWFYCFITNVEYINNETSEITYEIDSIQTWLLDCQLHDMFIEREHSLTDDIGDSLTTEPIKASNYILNDYRAFREEQASNMCLIGMFVDEQSHIYQNTLCGATLYAYTLDEEGITALNARLREYGGKADNVLGLYMTYGIEGIVGGESSIRNNALPIVDNTYAYTRRDNLNGYVPKNNKLFTYPYNYLSFISNSGDTLDLRFEFSNDHNNIKAVMVIPFIPPCAPVIFAVDYKGSENYGTLGDKLEGVNFGESISFPNPPMASYKTSSYYSILGMSQVSEAVDYLSNAFKGVREKNGSLVGDTSSLSLAQKIDRGVASLYDDVMGYRPSGSPKTSELAYALKRSPIHYAYVSVNAKTAKQIDDFFTMYGYACNEVKTPNIGNRPHWNYVKTRNADITGNAPQQFISDINNAFDRGITFWRNGDEIGNYSLDNSPNV